MSTATLPAAHDVGLDPTGIRRLTADARNRTETRAAVREAVEHEIGMLRKRRFRAAETIEQLDREISSLKKWLDREKGELQ